MVHMQSTEWLILIISSKNILWKNWRPGPLVYVGANDFKCEA
jgi:hypothetical protein